MVRFSRLLILALLLSVAGGTCLVGGMLSFSTPAHAQFWGEQRGGGFFGGLFGGGSPQPPRYYERQYERPYERQPRQRERPRHEQQPQQDSDFSHAPPPHANEAKRDTAAPTTTVVVMGDGMADWLAYGLEDAFADSPEIAIVRKNKAYSGLLHYDAKNDLDWWHVARDILAQEKPSYVVMMLGVTDRQSIRERDVAKEAEKEAKEEQDRKAEEAKKVEEAKKKAAEAAPNTAPEQGKPAADQEQKTADDSKPKRAPTGTLEFRSEQWEKVYIRRIDETIAALKSKGVPVFWVGLPAIRGTKSTADASYLNNLYRARAQRAGIVYIDVWDGFVDEDGRYTNYGPDYEGQERKLRSGDGVFFTNSGARKLAHYVEREIRRYMTNRVVSLPSQSAAPAAAPPPPDKPTERPLAGPVVPLAAMPAKSDQLIGGNGGGRVHGDALATQVLTKGEPIHSQPGRADDFAWPGGNQPSAAQPAPQTPAARPAKSSAAAKPETVAAVPPPSAPIAAQPAAAAEPAAEPEQAAPAVALTSPTAVEPEPHKKPAQVRRAEAKPKPPQQSQAPRPPRPVQQQQQRGPFDFFGAFR